jgi:hypothetical protein
VKLVSATLDFGTKLVDAIFRTQIRDYVLATSGSVLVQSLGDSFERRFLPTDANDESGPSLAAVTQSLRNEP